MVPDWLYPFPNSFTSSNFWSLPSTLLKVLSASGSSIASIGFPFSEANEGFRDTALSREVVCCASEFQLYQLHKTFHWQSLLFGTGYNSASSSRCWNEQGPLNGIGLYMADESCERARFLWEDLLSSIKLSINPWSRASANSLFELFANPEACFLSFHSLNVEDESQTICRPSGLGGRPLFNGFIQNFTR